MGPDWDDMDFEDQESGSDSFFFGERDNGGSGKMAALVTKPKPVVKPVVKPAVRPAVKAAVKPGAPVKKEQLSLGSSGAAPHAPSTAGSGNRVVVSVGKTINIGNFESLRVDYSQSVEVPAGTSFEEARKQTMAEALSGLVELIEVAEMELKR